VNEIDPHAWLADARAHLDESTQALDAATLSRLNRARQAALAQRRSRVLRGWWLPAAGLATSCALVLAVVTWYPSVRPAGSLAAVHPAVSDAEIGAADDGIEFYQDLEFYAWLDAQEQETGG
jgi:hypothetical protein